MIKNDELVLRFQFKSKYCYTVGENETWDVFAETLEDMVTFLTQHNFINDNYSIEQLINLGYVNYYPKDDVPDDECHILKSYKFKSNKYDELFTIFTTEHIVWCAVESVCQELTQSLVFGNIIIREDIEFISIINKLIGELPNVEILDYELSCNDTVDGYHPTYVDGRFQEPLELNNISRTIYDMMFGESQSSEIQPITIESYISTFACIISEEDERLLDDE